LRSSAVITGKRLLVSFGISDIMLKTPGLEKRWGASVKQEVVGIFYQFSASTCTGMGSGQAADFGF